jgi:tRNA(fMet)-specific endonuclease VapC
MEKQVLLDTDMLSFYMKGNLNVVRNFDDHIALNGYVHISRITVLEILGGLKAKNAIAQIERFKTLLKKHKILEMTELSTEISSDIFAELHKKGRHSGNYDILIAGIAIANDLFLCTNNEKDYENIDNLTFVNWTLKIG